TLATAARRISVTWSQRSLAASPIFPACSSITPSVVICAVTPVVYTLSLHDALPILSRRRDDRRDDRRVPGLGRIQEALRRGGGPRQHSGHLLHRPGDPLLRLELHHRDRRDLRARLRHPRLRGQIGRAHV